MLNNSAEVEVGDTGGHWGTEPTSQLSHSYISIWIKELSNNYWVLATRGWGEVYLEYLNFSLNGLTATATHWEGNAPTHLNLHLRDILRNERNKEMENIIWNIICFCVQPVQMMKLSFR